MTFILGVFLQELNSDIHHLKSDTLEGFALLEECRVRERQDLEPAYKELVRSRSLDPASARLMKTIHSQSHYIASGIREVDLHLDAEWEQYQRTKNNARWKQLIVLVSMSQTCDFSAFFGAFTAFSNSNPLFIIKY